MKAKILTICMLVLMLVTTFVPVMADDNDSLIDPDFLDKVEEVDKEDTGNEEYKPKDEKESGLYKSAKLAEGKLNQWDITIEIPFTVDMPDPTTQLAQDSIKKVYDSFGPEFELVGDPTANVGTTTVEGRNVNWEIKFGDVAPLTNEEHEFTAKLHYVIQLIPEGPYKKDRVGDDLFHPLFPVNTVAVKSTTELPNLKPIETQFPQPSVMPAAIRVENQTSEVLDVVIKEFGGAVLKELELNPNDYYFFDGVFNDVFYRVEGRTKNGILMYSHLMNGGIFTHDPSYTGFKFKLTRNEGDLPECLESWDSLARVQLINEPADPDPEPESPDTVIVRYFEKEEGGEDYVQTKERVVPTGEYTLENQDKNREDFGGWTEGKDGTKIKQPNDKTRVVEDTDFYAVYKKSIRVCFWEKDKSGEWYKTHCIDTPTGEFEFPGPKDPTQPFKCWGDECWLEGDPHKVDRDTDFYANYEDPIKVCFYEKDYMDKWEQTRCIETKDGKFEFPNHRNPNTDDKRFVCWGDECHYIGEDHEVKEDTDFYAKYDKPVVPTPAPTDPPPPAPVKENIKVRIRFVTPTHVDIPDNVRVDINNDSYDFNLNNGFQQVITVPDRSKIVYIADVLDGFRREIHDDLERNGLLEIVYIMIEKPAELPATGEMSTLPIVLGLLGVAAILIVVSVVVKNKNKKNTKTN